MLEKALGTVWALGQGGRVGLPWAAVLGPRACGECLAFSAHGSPGLTWLPRNPQCRGQLLLRTSYLEQS